MRARLGLILPTTSDLPELFEYTSTAVQRALSKYSGGIDYLTWSRGDGLVAFYPIARELPANLPAFSALVALGGERVYPHGVVILGPLSPREIMSALAAVFRARA